MILFWTIYSLLFLAIVPAVYGFTRYKSLPDYARVLVWVMLLNFLNELVTLYFAYARGNNMPVYYFYFALLSIALGFYFKSLLNDTNVMQWFYGCAVFCLLEFALFDYNQFNNYSSALVTVAAIFFSFKVLYRIIIKKVPLLAIFYTGCLLLFFINNGLQWALMRYLQASKEMSIILEFMKVGAVMNAICYLLLTYTIWWSLKYLSTARP